jgi:hypothetical protein
MKTLSVDFNAMTESDEVHMDLPRTCADIVEQNLGAGDWAWLSDGELIVGAQLKVDQRYGLVGVPDWDTLIHLDELDAENYVRVSAELTERMKKEAGADVDQARMLELMAQLEHFAPSDIPILRSLGKVSFQRALRLWSMGKLGLALREAKEARKALPQDPDVALLLLNLLRLQDLDSAVAEAETIASSSVVPAELLSGCINVLARCAEEAKAEKFESLSDRILD